MDFTSRRLLRGLTWAELAADFVAPEGWVPVEYNGKASADVRVDATAELQKSLQRAKTLEEFNELAVTWSEEY
jgi:hypothetical protein